MTGVQTCALPISADFVKMPFIIIGSIVVIIAIGILFIKLPEIKGDETVASMSALRKPHVLLGAIGIFCYVGAEVGTASHVSNYLTGLLDMAKDEAVKLTSIYWGGQMIGRFLGSVLLGMLPKELKLKYSAVILVFAFFVGWFIFSAGVVDGKYIFDSKPLYGLIFFTIAIINFLLFVLGRGIANISLGIFGATNMLLVWAVFLLPPQFGMWCLLSVGFFNSIMFPNIFSLAVNDLDPSEMPIASGIINTMIVGGSVVPLVMGAITDSVSIKASLLVPVICFGYITFFALKGSKIR